VAPPAHERLAGGMTRRRPAPLALLVAAVALAAARRISLGWGASPDERRCVLPGDELVPYPDLEATRAIMIDAPASDVWPWLVQIGQGRGGFYSYDRLEDLARLGIRSADTVVPHLQGLAPGDTVRLSDQVRLVVAALDPGHALVLSGAPSTSAVRASLKIAPAGEDDSPAPGGKALATAPPTMPYEYSWSFVLFPVDDRSCRLVVRERYGYTSAWAALLAEPVEWVSLLMTQKMLRGIRDRAEAHAPEKSAAADRQAATR